MKKKIVGTGEPQGGWCWYKLYILEKGTKIWVEVVNFPVNLSQFY